MRRSDSYSASATIGAPRRPIRVLVAEDSSTVRRLLVEILADAPGIEVVGEAAHGAEAVAMASALHPDLITMDVHMPVMDGLEATKRIMREAPTPILIVSAAAVRDDVALSLNAMQAGALMVVGKPDDPMAPRFDAQRTQLVAMVRAMAEVKVVRRWSGGVAAAGARANGRAAPVRPSGAGRDGRGVVPRLVAIAASTGGPAALHRIFLDLPREYPVPIVVVQHIAAGFVDGLASWLNAGCSLRVVVPADGEVLASGTIYLAPDGHHLAISTDGRAELTEGAPVGGFRPSADVLFDSAGRVYGAELASVVLSGMGRDGVDGLRTVHAAGGRVLAQDEASSVVYGMAQEAVRAGLVHEVLPLDRIARRLLEILVQP